MTAFTLFLFSVAAFFTHLCIAGLVNEDGWERRVLNLWGTDILWTIDTMQRGWDAVNTPKDQG